MNKFLLRRLGVADDPGGRKPTLQDCIEAVLAQSDTLVDDILRGLQASLIPALGKTQALQRSPSAKVAIEALQEHQDAFKATFAQSLRTAVYAGDTRRGREQPLVRFDDFQFLEEEQIDANIEIALTQQEVLMAVEDVLPNLNAMISSLMGWVTVQSHLNPLKPDFFVHALREAMAQHVAQETARVVVMTPAAGLMGASMRQLYKEVSDWLRSQGIEPVSPLTSTIGGFGVAIKPADNSVTRTMLTLDKLRRLLSGELDPGAMAAGVKDFLHTVPASFVALEDLKLVEPMMKRLAERADQTAFAAAQGAPAAKGVSVRGDNTQSKKLGRQLGEEVVRLMLENLMQDNRLLPPVRNSLKAMESALVKLSQSDARFFTERQHPARQFLDKLTNRSLAFSSVEEPSFAMFQKTLENAVNVLSLGGGDASSFARVLRKLEEGWTRDEHEQRQRAEEAARGLLHAEQRNLLAQRLAQDFSDRMLGKKIPEVVVAFLRGPWSQVVAQSQLLCADGTQDADGYLGIVDDLIWSVQKKLARRNRARLVEMVPGMLVKLRQGLSLIAYPPERIAAFFDELITIHERAFEAIRPAGSATIDAVPEAAQEAEGDVDAVQPQDLEAEVTEVAAPEMSDDFWMGQGEAAESGFLQDGEDINLDFTGMAEIPETPEEQDWSTDSLATGSWVDLALGGVWVRAQLTWASPHRTLFMFISGSGLAHSMSRRTMDRLHGLGLIRLVSDGHVMDNALDGVARAALRNDLGKASAEE